MVLGGTHRYGLSEVLVIAPSTLHVWFERVESCMLVRLIDNNLKLFKLPTT